jgi:hypothetical protein
MKGLNRNDKSTVQYDALKVHKHEFFFLTFFTETETIWSQHEILKIVFDSAEILDF